MSSVLTVPGIYFEPKARDPEVPFVRTDVAGFIGLEPRVRDGTTPSQLTGAPIPTGHKFQIDVAAFTLEVDDFRLDVPAATDFSLSANPALTLLVPGQSVVFGLAGVRAGLRLLALGGAVTVGTPQPPAQNELEASVRTSFGPDLDFERIADVQVERAGNAAVVTVSGSALIANGTTPCRFTGGPPPVGHEFQVDIENLDVVLGGTPMTVPRTTNFTLSRSATATLLAVGQSVAFAVVAVKTSTGLRLLAVRGAVVIGAPAPASTQNQLAIAAKTSFAPDLAFERIADVRIDRVGNAAVVTVSAPGRRPHVTNGNLPCRFTGAPSPTGHQFQVNIESFELVVDGSPMTVPQTTNFVLSASGVSTLLAAGQSVAFAIAAAKTGPGLVSAKGSLVTTGLLPAPAPADSVIEAEVQAAFGPTHDWRRIADIEYIRSGLTVRTIIRPALPPSPCDDFRDYVRRFGAPIDDGTFLGSAVRAFFANGASRCWVATVRRPKFDDAAGLELAREDMIGIKGSPEREATGLERLLLIGEVSIVDAVDLYARHAAVTEETVKLPPTKASACFQDCDKGVFGPVTASAGRSVEALEPLYSDASVFDAQRRMLERIIPERWRAFLLLAPPLELDPTDGKFHGPTVEKAIAWREQFFGLAEEEELSCAALYFPWVLSQEQTGDPVFELPPTPFVAGVMARRDLARGAHVSPANETVRAVVGLTRVLNDEIHGNINAPPRNINALRPFPSFGIQVWGARTLSNDIYLRYLAVRRCLSAIERRVAAALEDIVFEPNTPIMWLHVTQIVFQVLTPIFESGALRGARPEEAFVVRCDFSNNPREAVEAGRLLVEVGVAIAAPAEFIVFRVGRREGVVEVME